MNGRQLLLDTFLGKPTERVPVAPFVFNNVVSKPEWWTTQVTRVYLGTYSRKKYEEFVKCTGVTNFGALNTAEKRAYSLTFKRYIAQNNVMDADGKEFPMTVPIN